MHSKFYFSCAAIIAVAFGCSISPVWGADPAVRCESGKLKESAKYGNCRLKVESKAVKKGLTPDFSKCTARFTKNFVKEELKPGGALCPTLGDEVDINSRITQHADNITILLAGGALPVCGDGSMDPGEQCDGIDLGGADCATLGFTGGALACSGSCFYDLSGCTGTSGGLVPGIDPILPVTGQTTVYGPGSDGDVQAGTLLAYADNGDGTITDLNTGLMWEKKDDSGGIGDADNTYTWCTDVSPLNNICDNANNMDGTIVTTFLNTLNDVTGGGVNCFAGHCDWRIPNIKELQSIVDYESTTPSVDPKFHRSGTCTGCTDVTLASCSCTALSGYWSSTTVRFSTAVAWFVAFDHGDVSRAGNKIFGRRVRAVRGGL